MPLVVSLAVAVLLAGCTGSYHAAASPSYSRGSIAVPGNESGIAGGVEAGYLRTVGKHRYGGAVTADLMGYSSAADGDPILWIEGQARFRTHLTEGKNVLTYAELGVGLGWAGGYIDKSVASAFAAIGFEHSLGAGNFGVSLRARPAYFIGDGDPAAEFNTVVALAFAAGFDLAP